MISLENTLKVSTVKKVDDELQIVYGEVYAPGIPDSQGEYATEEEIRKMAHKFLSSNRSHKVDVNHNHQNSGEVVVESFVARKGDPDFIEGAWVVGIHVPSDDGWKNIKKGVLNGFSMEGKTYKRDSHVIVNLPDEVHGPTEVTDGHSHTFIVMYNQETAAFEGGRTDEVNGHYHEIKKGTATEEVNGHRHRFCMIEEMVYKDEE